ncbi:MAG: protein kinase, partial [Thiomargarita sp.]|nr:protein kinase [Thiomargarita sp.]
TATVQEEIKTLKAVAMKAIEHNDFSQITKITPQLEQLQTSINNVPIQLQTAQDSLHEIIDFSHRFENWTDLVETKVDDVLRAMDVLQWTVGKIDRNIEILLQEFRQFMQQFNLSSQIKMSNEFTYHNIQSRRLIEDMVKRLKALPFQKNQYNQVVMMAGSVLSSTGNIAESEKFFLQAQQNAQNSDEKALASFNLFQAQLRNQDYKKAVDNLQTAIKIDKSRYALHDVDRFPIIKLLGAGGMGCVFLCHNQWRDQKVVVKCFWEGRTGTHKDVFGEAMMMRKIAGDYVPKPLDCGYVNSRKQERPYFVTEYLEGAIDGERWLKAHGKLDVQTGLAVGLDIAKGLHIAAQEGIMHLDLKPANVLFQHTDTGISVKIIDFGLSKIATSLSQEAQSCQTAHTQFGQAIISDTWDYAPPEQMGIGTPTSKSDIYAFGATLYRLMTLESPRLFNLRHLSQAPELFE